MADLTERRQLEIIVDRLKREFNVEATVGKPQVAYKETLTRPADDASRRFVEGEFESIEDLDWFNVRSAATSS